MPLVASNLTSDWRRAVVSELKTAYPTAIVQPGRRSGVSRELRACVFDDGYGPMADRIVVANPVLVIRMWPPRGDIPTTQNPADPTDLEQLREELLLLIQARQVQIEGAVDDLWYFHVESAVIDEDPDEWGVEIRLKGFGRNLSLLP